MRKKLQKILVSLLMLISSATFAQNVRGFYLQDVGDWLGNATKENEILAYAQGNGFNYILFYDLGDINWSSSTEKNLLGAFMTKARNNYGITQIGGVVEYSGYVSQKLLPYNNSRTSSKEKFDVINLEFEFWISSSVSYYCNKFLSAAGYPCSQAGAWDYAWKEFKTIDDICAANGMISEFYLGWPTASQMASIASRADRILLSAYRPSDSDIYLYSKQRMKDIAAIGGRTKVLTLLSSESSFMGPWLTTHPQNRPYQTMDAALTSETATFKQNIDLQGYTWFTYKYMPKTTTATASISASGPLAFCPGGSVTLTANTGASYLWSTGATTQSINVTSAGSYTVRVTNSSGAAATSAATVVTTSGTGSTPTVSASGPTSFCPGSSVTLTSSPASSYLWTNGATTQSITVSSSGTYSVTTGSGGCSGTSAAVTVNASSAPSVPTITASGSTNVCPGTVLTLTSSLANGYLWSTGATTRSIVVAAGGNYTVTAYSGPNCSAISAIKTVTVLTAPTAPVVTAGSSTTLSTSNPSVTLTSSSANSYSWTTGATTRSISVNTQGTYRVVTTGSNGCSATSNVITVTANGCTPPPVPTITASGSLILVSGQSVTLTSSASGGYLWSTGAQTQSITVTTPGIYTVRNYNKGSCFSTSLPSVVTVLLPKMKDQSIAEESNSIKLSAYPNPASEQLNLVFNASDENDNTIKLVDLTGREVQARTITPSIGENQVQLDVSSLPNGIYLAYLLRDNDKQVVKVIVE